MHYKTIKLNINTTKHTPFSFCGALCAQCFILRLCAQSAPIYYYYYYYTQFFFFFFFFFFGGGAFF